MSRPRPDAIEAIEIAVARYWPDFTAIREATGATTNAIACVIGRLEAIELGETQTHTCQVHPRGSLACNREHGCWCKDCDRAAAIAAHRAAAREAGSEVNDYREYERMRKAGIPAAEMPASVRDAGNAYQRARKKIQRQRKAATLAETAVKTVRPFARAS